MALTDLQDALTARYGEDAPSEIVENPIVEALLAHRSVRAYTPDPLPAHALQTMIAAAQSSSSSSNLQTWSVVAVSDPQRKATLASYANDQAHIREAPLHLVWLADLSRLRDAAASRGIEAKGLDYLELYTVGCIDAALAAQNAAIAAESLGLGIVYIGGMRNRPVEVAEALKLPSGVFAVFGMCVGYPDPARPATVKPRLPQSSVLFKETYNRHAAGAAIKAYDTLMDAFYTSQKMDRDPWSLHSAKRVAGPERLSGRDQLRSILNRLGFALK
ncbi:nitroreductase family protein [Pelagibacterium sp.]|uniref:nitroreductase family protein n=1 Tax=Pelagibacterium sp. TaxID=1967288 RepID=UPI003A9334EF